jgi:hypothetical protein
MNKILLITRPNHDLATNYLFYWSQLVIQKAKKGRIKVLDLKKNKANKKNFQSYIARHKPKLIFFNGHGSEDAIAGHNDEILVKINKNEETLAGKIVYARSCDAAQKLGPQSIKKKTIAFIGYKRKYLLGYSQLKISQPLKDEIAKLFLEPSNLIPISLLKGNTAGDSYQKSQKAMWRNLSYMFSSKASQAQKDAAPYLWINRKYQVILGNNSAKL